MKAGVTNHVVVDAENKIGIAFLLAIAIEMALIFVLAIIGTEDRAIGGFLFGALIVTIAAGWVFINVFATEEVR